MKCPVCKADDSLVLDEMQQAAYVHKILKNGRISKRRRYVKYGSEEWALVSCKLCGTSWTNTDKDGFCVGSDGKIHFMEENHND